MHEAIKEWAYQNAINSPKRSRLMPHTPGPFICKKCGWSGVVLSRPRCLACYRERVKKWRSANRDKYNAQKARHDKRMRATRRDEYNAIRRRNRKPETNAAARRLRIAWLMSGDVTREQLIEIFNRDNGQCVHCGAKVSPRFTPTDPRGFDHVISRQKGGKHTAANITTCCRRCNELKR